MFFKKKKQINNILNMYIKKEEKEDISSLFISLLKFKNDNSGNKINYLFTNGKYNVYTYDMNYHIDNNKMIVRTDEGIEKNNLVLFTVFELINGDFNIIYKKDTYTLKNHAQGKYISIDDVKDEILSNITENEDIIKTQNNLNEEYIIITDKELNKLIKNKRK